ncbi:UNVERIFIED_CONTAM: hypothetical protein K2H54_047621 [Gekko kuhli]
MWLVPFKCYPSGIEATFVVITLLDCYGQPLWRLWAHSPRAVANLLAYSRGILLPHICRVATSTQLFTFGLAVLHSLFNNNNKKVPTSRYISLLIHIHQCDV